MPLLEHSLASLPITSLLLSIARFTFACYTVARKKTLTCFIVKADTALVLVQEKIIVFYT